MNAGSLCVKKMKKLSSCGVIVEYNPLHNGHCYHLQQARELSQSDVIVAVMSGQFVQRGEPAILDKTTRARLALEAGADLVVELPWFGAVQSADYFARESIRILQALHVDSLCFGSDGTEAFDYAQFALEEYRKKKELDQAYQWINQQYPSWNYPKKLQASYELVFPNKRLDLSKPNHILGLSYARYNNQYPNPMKIYSLKRHGAQHHDTGLRELASGTAIRNAVFSKDISSVQQSLPVFTYQAIQTSVLHSWDMYFELLKAQCLTKSNEELKNIYQMVDGLEYKIQKQTFLTHSMDEWVKALKSKRYSYVRLQRLGTYILTNTTTQEMEWALNHPYVRVLGFNAMGRKYLHQTEADLPVITNIRQQDARALQNEKKWDGLYLSATQDEAQFLKNYHPISI